MKVLVERIGEVFRYSYYCDYPVEPHDDPGAPLTNRPVFAIRAFRSRWRILFHNQPLNHCHSHIYLPLLSLTSPVGAHALTFPLDAVIARYLAASAINYRRDLMDSDLPFLSQRSLSRRHSASLIS